MDIPLFFSPIETHCPICGEPVRKVVEEGRGSTSQCQNEFYAHEGDTLIKFKEPVAAWEETDEYKAAADRGAALQKGP